MLQFTGVPSTRTGKRENTLHINTGEMLQQSDNTASQNNNFVSEIGTQFKYRISVEHNIKEHSVYNIRHNTSTHSKIKQYQCNQCDYSTAKKSNLMQHKLTHTNKRLHHCEVCPFTANLKSNLKQHMLIHTGER